MRAALYLRVSTEQQVEKYSLPAQKRLLVEYCERQGWEYTIYEDAGISGETIDARPAMRRLLEDALARRFNVVLAVEMERFSRSRDGVDLSIIKRIFREAGIRFGTPAQLFNPTDVEDDFLSGMLGLLASREKQKIRERSMRGKLEAARQGRYIVSHAPYGYRLAGKGEGALVVHETEASVVRQIFSLLADAGKSSRAISLDLTARGIPAPLGRGRWHFNTVLKILRNTAYVGRAIYNKTYCASAEG